MKKVTSQLATLAIMLVIFLTPYQASTCTRVVYQGPNGTIITARSMDWKTDIPANLWIFPKGIERNGEAGTTSVKWKSKYGSVITSSWDIATSDGMNEKGLAGNLLWLVETEYAPFEKDKGKQGLSVSLWLQYVLDNFTSVEEAVVALSKEDFVVVSSFIPGTDIFATVHLSISDKMGDNAIFEYINGKLIIHHDRSFTTMTNLPIFEEQLAINTYWKNIPGTIMLPGTNRAADRFVKPRITSMRFRKLTIHGWLCQVFSVSSEIARYRWEFLLPQNQIFPQPAGERWPTIKIWCTILIMF